MDRKKNKLVHGWGVVDVDYNVQVRAELPKVGGKRKRKVIWVCPYYQKWKDLIKRCFCPKYQEKRPTYKDCTVTEEWKYLSKTVDVCLYQLNEDFYPIICNISLSIYQKMLGRISNKFLTFTHRQIQIMIILSG